MSLFGSRRVVSGSSFHLEGFLVGAHVLGATEGHPISTVKESKAPLTCAFGDIIESRSQNVEVSKMRFDIEHCMINIRHPPRRKYTELPRIHSYPRQDRMKNELMGMK